MQGMGCWRCPIKRGSVEPSPDPAHTNNTQQAEQSDDSVRRQCRNICWRRRRRACDHNKAGRSAVQSICGCVVDAVSVRIDHDIIMSWHEPGMPDEHRTHNTTSPNEYGLD